MACQVHPRQVLLPHKLALADQKEKWKEEEEEVKEEKDMDSKLGMQGHDSGEGGPGKEMGRNIIKIHYEIPKNP